MNVYKLLLNILGLCLLTFAFLMIEVAIFDESIVVGLIGNAIVALLFFLLYKSNQADKKVKNDLNNLEDKK